VTASRRVKCLDMRSRWAVIRAYILVHRLPTTDGYYRYVDPGILSSHLVCVCCFASSITSAYVKNFTVPYGQKSFQTCDGASLVVTSVCWLSHGGDSVQGFMAVYGRGRSLTRDTTDQHLHLVSCCVKVSAVTSCARFR